MTTDELKKEAQENCVCTDEYMAKMFEIGYIAGAEPREKRIAELEATCNKWFEHLKNREEELLNELNNQNAKYNKQIEELEKENAEFRKEWQEQVQKATDEGYARTLQTIQLTKAKDIIKKFLLWENDLHDKTESKYELLKQAEQFIKDSEVEK